MKLSDAERKTLEDLKTRQKEAEDEERAAEVESKAAEKAKLEALKTGSKEEKKEAIKEAEIARMSESSAAALTERIDAMLGLLEESLKARGVSQEEITKAKSGKRVFRT